MRVHRPIIVACAVCVILVVLENVLGQILTLIPASTGILPERNFCENILFVGMGAWALNRCVRTLRIRAQELPTISNPLAAEFVASSAQCFAQKHGLSAREVEVLLLVLRGEGNKEIADSLFLSVNTVKVHVHHILRKCGTGGPRAADQVVLGGCVVGAGPPRHPVVTSGVPAIDVRD